VYDIPIFNNHREKYILKLVDPEWCSCFISYDLNF